MSRSGDSPEPAGGFAAFYESVCSELRQLGVEQFRAEFDALDSDLERVQAVLRLRPAASALTGDGAPRLCHQQAGRTLKSVEQAQHFLQLASNCTAASQKLVLCNTALQHCPASAEQLLWPLTVHRLWAVFELGQFRAGLAETDRLLQTMDESTERRVQLLVERARCQAALALRPQAEQSVRDALQIIRQLDKTQQAMYATELGSVRKRLVAVADSGAADADGSERSADPAPRLFAGEHQQLRRVSAAVNLEQRPGRGRCLVANTDIPAGSLVITDSPFAWSLHPPRWTTHCQNCCRPVVCALPCPDCASVLFCGEQCRSEAMRQFHAAECPVLDFLIEPGLGRMALLVYRILARAGADTLTRYGTTDTGDGWRRPAETQARLGSTQYDSLSYPAILSQVTNSGERPMGDVVKRCCVALCLTACLERAGLCTAEQREQTAALALRHLQSCSCNAYEITELELTAAGAPGGEFAELGGAVYAAVSLTNHSCFPNVVRANHGRHVRVTSTRPLHAGDELLDNYGFHFHEEEELARYEALRRQYQFQCECVACEHGWPQYAELEAGAPPGAEQQRAVERVVQRRFGEAAATLARLVTADEQRRQLTAAPDRQAVQRISLLTRCIQGAGNTRH